MRYSYFFSLCLLLTLFLGSCKKEETVAVPETLLERTWLHSYEDDRDGIEVYRPDTYAFLPSRGRTGFTFNQGGLFTQLDIAPTDGLESRGGKWVVASENVLLIHLGNQLNAGYKLEIVSLQNDVLKVRRSHF